MITCFEKMKNNLTEEVGRWLNFMDFDHRRLGCVNYDPVGQFYRHKEFWGKIIFKKKKRQKVRKIIKTVEI